MSNDKYTGPWAPGMRDIDGGYPFGASLVVSVGAHGLPDRWVLLSEPETIRYTNSRAESEYAWEGCSPDWADPATVGAIAEAVRVSLHRPFLETQVGADRNFYIVDFAPENEPQESPDWPTMRTDGAFGNNLKPEVRGANRGLAWLAAYHAHRDAAGLTANDIEVIRA